MRRTTRTGRIAGSAFLLAVAASMTAAPAFAQGGEVSIEPGYTGSEGVNATQGRVILGQIYNSLDIKSGGSVGFTVGFYLGPNDDVEFPWNRQNIC